MTIRIMLVEDELIVAMDLRQRLENMGYQVTAHAISGDEAIRAASENPPDLILMDIKIKGKLDGIETATKIRAMQDVPVIYVTAFADDATLNRARLTEAFGYLIKPFEDRELHSAIEIAIYKHEMEKKLRESEECYRKVVETSPDGIGISDLKGILIGANQKNAEMWGYDTPQEMIGVNAFDLITPEDRPLAAYHVRNLIDGEKNAQFECRFQRKDGSIFAGEMNAACLHHANGQVKSIMAIARDITDRKQVEAAIYKINSDLEQRVISRTAELAMYNKELEAFSYSIAHDLRAPLRAMMGFSQILGEEYTKCLDSQGQDYLKRIQNSAGTMSVLIDDLLNLSRINRAEMARTEIDLGGIARQVAVKLTGTQPERKVEFLIPEHLMVNADPALIRIILENLLGNSWKFSSKIDSARIELGSLTENEQTVLFVKDNGAGFDMAYADKLFGPFQRLHTDHEFEGNGIGLSIVERIVHRHSGRIWAKGEVGKGATFYFTLPNP